MQLDWADGNYSLVARELEPIAEVAVGRAGVASGQRVLDVGCGTGNAALAAARRGALVTGVDPASGLLELARSRAREAGLDVEFLEGDAGDLRIAHGPFDVALSVFGVIFASDAGRAARGMIEAVRPGGVVVVTTWLPLGPIAAAGRILREALPAIDTPPPHWDEPRWVTDLLVASGAGRIGITEETHVFRADSPEQLLQDAEDHHPVWRWARRLIPPERWELVRRDSLDAFRSGNEDARSFAATSPYLLVHATR
jgi:SAM-dependent methyltransferase